MKLAFLLFSLGFAQAGIITTFQDAFVFDHSILSDDGLTVIPIYREIMIPVYPPPYPEPPALVVSPPQDAPPIIPPVIEPPIGTDAPKPAETPESGTWALVGCGLLVIARKRA